MRLFELMQKSTIAVELIPAAVVDYVTGLVGPVRVTDEYGPVAALFMAIERHRLGIHQQRKATTSWPQLKILFQQAGWPYLARDRATQALRGYPALVRGRATSAAQGWPTLKFWRDNNRHVWMANLMRIRERQAAEGYQNLVRSREWQAANDHPQLQIGHVVKREEAIARWNKLLMANQNLTKN